MVRTGHIYRHYKGGRYLVLFIATHSETGEDTVVYRRISDGSDWCRPLSSWQEPVSDGRTRFELEGAE